MSVRPGDDLYTDCVLALDPDTGKLKWYFQFTPHDLYDYDATETPVLVDADYKASRASCSSKRIAMASSMCSTAPTENFSPPSPFVEKLNWAKGIDADGRPIRTGVQPTARERRVCPGFEGATNWYSPAYNPDRILLFSRGRNCAIYVQGQDKYDGGKTFYSTGS